MTTSDDGREQLAADPNLISEAGAVLQAMAKDGIRISDRAFERYVDVHLAEFDRRGEELREYVASAKRYANTAESLRADLAQAHARIAALEAECDFVERNSLPEFDDAIPVKAIRRYLRGEVE